MAHHHHQHQHLNAHSQLTHVGQGQIHYIQFPASVLPSGVASSYHQESSTIVPQPRLGLHQQHVQRVTSTGGDLGGGCIICFGTLPPRIARGAGGKKPVEVFLKVCEILKVPSEVQSEWDFGHGEKLPFCIACSECVQTVIVLHEQLEIIQRKLSDGIENIRSKIRQANNRVTATDIRTANFRSSALGDVTHTQKTSSNVHQSINSTTTVSDFSSIFNPALLGFQQQQQQYATQSSSHATFSTLQPVTSNQTQPTFSISEFLQDPVNTVTVNSNADEYNNDNEGNTYFDDRGDDYSSHTGVKSDSDKDSDNDFKPEAEDSPKKKKRGNASRNRGSVGTSSRRNAVARPRANSGRQNAEFFAPVITGADGKRTFEGITITPGNVGFICGLCSAECGKGHTSAALRKIKIHIKGFHLGAYKCSICNKNFTSNDILSQHTVRAHQQPDTPCDICGRPVRPRYLNHHKFTHMNAEEKEACIAAGFKPQSNHDLERKFMCNTCGKMFKKKSVLRRHEASHKDASLRKDFKCDLCDKAYTTYQALRDHNNLHHDPGNMRKAMCKHCGKVMYPKYLRKHMKTHIAKEERPFVCKICGRRLVNLKTLQIHEAKHEPNDQEVYKFECDICGQRFRNFKRMRSHRRKIHPNHWKLAVPSKLINDVTVDKPGEEFFLQELENEELQEVDSAIFSYCLYEIRKIENPNGFRCCACSQECLGEGKEAEESIKAHIRVEHMGNFRCNLCSKRMKNINEVLGHLRRDHMNKDEMPCDICGRPGLATSSIKAHEWSHKTVYDIADAINSGEKVPQRYEKSLNQRQMVLIEFGMQFEFQCSLCDTVFDMLEDLYQHRLNEHKFVVVEGKHKSHTNRRKGRRGRKRKYPEGPAECTECGKIFENFNKVNRHIRKVHMQKYKKSGNNMGDEVESKARGETDNEQQEDEVHPTIKTEIFTSSESSESDSDDTEIELDEDYGSESDPEFKATAKLHIEETPVVTLRARASLRPRRNVTYRDEDNEADDSEEDTKVNRKRMQVGKGRRTVKLEDQRQYVSPDEESNEMLLLSEKDMKQSPHTSEDEEEWASNGECDNDEEN